MSQLADGTRGAGSEPRSDFAGLTAGIAGLILGGLATAVGMYGYGFRLETAESKQGAGANPAIPATPPAGGPAAGPPMMGMGGMGMGMGMGMGGGGAREKRSLTSLVGRIELLSRKDLNLHIDLDPDQMAKLASKLADFKAAETMTGDEAQAHREAIEAILKPEQLEVLDRIALPFARRGGGGPGGGRPGGGGPGAGGPGAGGPGAGGPGAGGPPGGGMGMMGMGGGGDPNENPFSQEANGKTLGDLIERVSAASKAPSDSP